MRPDDGEERARAVRFGVAAALGVGVLVVLGLALPVYWVYLLTAVAISALIARGIGVVTIQTGIVTLCQLSFAAIGGWIVARLSLTWPEAPFALSVVVGGVVAAPIGGLLGAMTARVRGVELAVVTLGFAAVVDLVFREVGFPGVGSGTAVLPAPPLDDPRWFYALAWALLLALQLGIGAAARSRFGLSWNAVRASERAAAAAGIRVPMAKASAFAVGALCAGLAGGMLAGQYGLLTTSVFSPLTSMIHLATAVLCGASLFSGAVLAGVLAVGFPECLRRLGLPLDVGNALLALGAFDVLRRGTGGLAEQLQSWREDRRFRGARVSCTLAPLDPKDADAAGVTICATPSSRPPAPRLEVVDLTVAFGGSRALDGVSLSLLAGDVHALIGPNGAGKTTLVDAVTGFLPKARGTVRCGGVSIDTLPAFARARAGIRRTFQQSRAIPELTVAQYLRIAAPGSSAAVRAQAGRFLGLPSGTLPVRLLDVGSRRLLEIAGALAAEPAVLLLDEPAAGLGEAERLALAARVRAIPEVFDCAVLLIEHDMGFVRAASNQVSVLEAGRVIASGEVVPTLEASEVVEAYLGRGVAS